MFKMAEGAGKMTYLEIAGFIVIGIALYHAPKRTILFYLVAVGVLTTIFKLMQVSMAVN
jgi:hypothetical protein